MNTEKQNASPSTAVAMLVLQSAAARTLSPAPRTLCETVSKEWIRRDIATRRAKVSMRTLERWILEGSLRTWKRNARVVFVWYPDLVKLMPPVDVA